MDWDKILGQSHSDKSIAIGFIVGMLIFTFGMITLTMSLIPYFEYMRSWLPVCMAIGYTIFMICAVISGILYCKENHKAVNQ